MGSPIKIRWENEIWRRLQEAESKLASMDAMNNEHQEQPSNEFTVDNLDVDFLPIIYDIIRSVERDPHDNAQKNSQSQDISQKVVELHKKLELAKEQIRRLPGVEYSKEEQLEKLDNLRKQLKLKRELLQKYRSMYILDSLKP